MAKKLTSEDEQVVREEAAAQSAYERTAQGQAEKTVSERAAEGDRAPELTAFAGRPGLAEPVVAPEVAPVVVLDAAKGIIPERDPETAAACWCREAREVQGVWQGGAAVSPEVLKSLVSRAIGLLS